MQSVDSSQSSSTVRIESAMIGFPLDYLPWSALVLDADEVCAVGEHPEPH